MPSFLDKLFNAATQAYGPGQQVGIAGMVEAQRRKELQDAITRQKAQQRFSNNMAQDKFGYEQMSGDRTFNQGVNEFNQTLGLQQSGQTANIANQQAQRGLDQNKFGWEQDPNNPENIAKLGQARYYGSQSDYLDRDKPKAGGGANWDRLATVRKDLIAKLQPLYAGGQVWDFQREELVNKPPDLEGLMAAVEKFLPIVMGQQSAQPQTTEYPGAPLAPGQAPQEQSGWTPEMEAELQALIQKEINGGQ